MKVLVSDSLSNEGLEILKEHFTVDVSTGLSEDELVKKIKDYDALVIRSGTQVTPEDYRGCRQPESYRESRSRS